MTHAVVCRTCALTYLEDAGDPCPGLCAPCFEAALQLATADLAADVDDPTIDAHELVPRHAARLRALGITEANVGVFVATGTQAVAGAWRRPN